MEYAIIILAVLIISPFVISVASKQDKKSKSKLKSYFIGILTFQLLMGFLGWENFSFSGKNGIELALAYPSSLLAVYFLVISIQIIFMVIQKFPSLVIILNFINTVILFAGLIRISNAAGFQLVSLANIASVFAVLIGNVIGLIWINKDKNLLKKYAHQKGFSFIPLLVVAGIIVLSGILLFPKISPLVMEKVGQQLEQVASTKISSKLAVENVKKLPEVQEYLKNVPNGKVEVDNEIEGEYNVHVYEVKDGHTATFNWYRVSIKSGEVRSEFSIEQQTNEQEQKQQQSYKTYKEQSKPAMPTGIVSGKICYPSEVIPKGKLEVKRLMDDYIIYEDYPGTIDGAEPTYSFQLEPGDYYIRYNVDDKLFGYSTTVCPTGNEKTCADTKQRVPVMAVVKDGQELKNYDLCDYYYKDSNAPKF
ncbi:hypothetical protein M1437_01560 [Patescibacteria group bacterium]|nr:hypothetical protein [Patescibacteria group bacterium]